MHSFDDVILDFMTEQDIPGASVALSKDGKLFYCQGKQWGCAGQLLASFFPVPNNSPRGLCKS